MRDFSIDLVWAKLQMAIAAVGGWLGYFVGGVDGLMTALLVLMVMDYVTGVMCAVIDRELSSSMGFRGIFKKVLILMLVGVAHIVDLHVVQSGEALRSAVICFYLSNEGVSVLENAGHLGLPIPEKLSYEEGALIEPVANGMYAVRNSRIDGDTNIVVIGCGPIGIGDFLCARLYDPRSILMVDVADFNLQKAREMGAELTCNSRSENLYERVMELTGGVGADLVFLAYGDAPTLQQAAEICRRGGQLVQHALMEDGIGFPYRVHQQHELDFKAYNMYTNEDFRLIAEAIDAGKMDLSHFVTQRYPIEQFAEAMHMADKRPEPVLKVMMTF